MAEPVLEAIVEDFKTITPELKRAKELIGVLKEAGEDTVKIEADIRNLEIRKTKWERVLAARGYKIPK